MQAAQASSEGTRRHDSVNTRVQACAAVEDATKLRTTVPSEEGRGSGNEGFSLLSLPQKKDVKVHLYSDISNWIFNRKLNVTKTELHVPPKPALSSPSHLVKGNAFFQCLG